MSMSFMDAYDHLRIELKDIKLATDNFSSNKLIGRGGFGQVYKGELSLHEEIWTMVAVKCLDRKHGQGNIEFLKEIVTLSKYKHENLVKLLHFCVEGGESILVYEYASHGSLDVHLSNPNLSWAQRLKICIGVAYALNYLHDPMKTHHRVLHRDIKSANILLDENWSAKISDFGLSKVGPANQTQTFMLSNVVGTPGYCDPAYWGSGVLSKESDVYSFGVVLFELMCGKLCCEYRNGKLIRIFVDDWKECFGGKRLGDIVFPSFKEEIESDNLMAFAAIANKCTNKDPRERPRMVEIIKELEIVLEKHNTCKFPKYLVELAALAEPPLRYESEEELLLQLSKGFLYKDKTWLSINKNGRVCEMMSAFKCITSKASTRKEDFQVLWTKVSRFDYVITNLSNFKIDISTEFLEPGVIYTINLIYKLNNWDHGTCALFKYKLEEETHYSCPSFVELRANGWLSVQLHQFTSHQRKQHFIIECFCLKSCGQHVLEGIEFLPITNEREEKNKVNIESVSNTDTNWEGILADDYRSLIMLSKNNVRWRNNKELYLILRKGFLVDNSEKVINDQQWFSISKKLKKRVMIPPKAFLDQSKWVWKSYPESRFEAVAESLFNKHFAVDCKINSQCLSPYTFYSCHLVYKLLKNYYFHKCTMAISIDSHISYHHKPRCIYLINHHIPVIDENSHVPILSPLKSLMGLKPDLEGYPKLRKDGWMEIQFLKVSTKSTGTIQISAEFLSHECKEEDIFSGLVVQGIEFRYV